MNPPTYVFDEIYYVPEAKFIIAHSGVLNADHPPLAKLFIAGGINLFGDNPFGWRFFSIIFGTISIVLIYLICRRLNMSRLASNIAAFLFGLENLAFIQASIAMLDVYSVTFMLAALFLFIRRNLALSGLFVSLSMLAKLTGALTLAIFFLYWIFTERRKWKTFVIPAAVAMVSFLVLMPVLDFVTIGQLINPLQRLESMSKLSSSISSTSIYLSAVSRPWDWIANKGALFYFNDPQYIGLISFTVSVFVVPVMFYLVYLIVKKSRVALFVLIWFACVYLPWIPISLFMHRLMYIHYFYPAIAAVCAGLGFGLSRIIEYWRNNRRNKLALTGGMLAFIYLVIHLVIFIILSPLAPALAKWVNI